MSETRVEVELSDKKRTSRQGGVAQRLMEDEAQWFRAQEAEARKVVSMKERIKALRTKLDQEAAQRAAL
jgi:hypothetical protein